MKVTKAEALKIIEAAGWKKLYPDIPLYDQFYFDGKDQNVGYAWLVTYREIMRRKKTRQLYLPFVIE